MPIGSALFGGGPADDMAISLGADPSVCGLNRSRCPGYETPNEKVFPSHYAGSGSSEDFAESFKRSVIDSVGFQSSNPQREAFIASLATSLTTAKSEFVGSPYFSRRIGASPAPTPTR